MFADAVRRRLIAGVIVGVLLAAPLAAWAESEAEQIARAKQLVAEKKHGDALAILNPLTTSLEPTARQAKESLEFCYRSAERWADAILTLESCLRDYPADAALWQARLGRCYKESGDYPKAIAALRAGLAFTPRTPRETTVLTQQLMMCCLLAKEGWDDAASFYESLLTKQPQDAAQWRYQLGFCYRRMGGKTTEAMAELEKAMRLVKADADAVKRVERELSGAYQDAGEFDKAEALLAKLKLDYPVHAAHWQTRLDAVRIEHPARLIDKGYKLQKKGEYDNAMPVYDEVIDRFADCSRELAESAHVCVAECLQLSGKPEEARAYAKKLCDEQPDMRCGAVFAQGMLDQWSGKYDQSAAAFRRVLDECSGNTHAPLARSYGVAALEKAGRIDEAAYALSAIAAEESDPERKTAYLVRTGVIYYEAKRYRDAIKAFKEVRTFENAPAEMKAEATYRCGLSYHGIKYYSSARMCMDQVVKLYPESEWAKKARGALYVWTSYGEQAEVK